MNDQTLLRIRLFSRFRNSTRYQIYIHFNAAAVENEEQDQEIVPILGHYCTCKSEAKTLGCCAHIASVLWYLGHARHEARVKYPSTDLLNNVFDAGHRPPQLNLNDPRIIEG